MRINMLHRYPAGLAMHDFALVGTDSVIIISIMI